MTSTKSFDKKQLKLLRMWLDNPRFLNKVEDSQHIQFLKNCIHSGTYNPVDKNHLMKMRKRWINFLIQERKLVYLTRKQKNIITNGMLNTKESFRIDLYQDDVDFLVQTLKDGYYKKTKQDQFNLIFQKWKLYDELPF